jgi:hypothetical protein
MLATSQFPKSFVLAIIFAASLASAAFAQQKASLVPEGRPVAYRDPGDLAKRDLRTGPCNDAQAPAAPYTFVAEDKLGASPKFKVRDARGVIWSVKLGEEAQAETVATRLVWAMGYFAEDSYYFQSVEVQNLPKLSRGQEFVQNRNTVRGARFEARRDGEQRTTNWEWDQNPFLGTREFNGLKVMMALLGNYDIRPENNLIFAVRNESGETEARYVVSDIGAVLGKVGGLGGKRSKNNLADYSAAKFVVGVDKGMVQFDFKTKPKGMGFFASIFKPSYGKSQAMKEKVMSNIPAEDARWMGTRLAQLSDEQLRDAFRAAGYDGATMDGYVSAIRNRINQLVALPTTVADDTNSRR